MTKKKIIGVIGAGSCNDGKTVIGIETWEGVDDIIRVKNPDEAMERIKKFTPTPIPNGYQCPCRTVQLPQE